MLFTCCFQDSVSTLVNGHRFEFSIIEGDDSLVHVGKDTGLVTLVRSLSQNDLESGEVHFNVSVSDGIFTAYAKLVIRAVASYSLQPPPKFERMYYSATVKENG